MHDRTCLVTGASRGIGRGIAEEFATEGASIAVNFRSAEEKAAETIEAIEAAGGEAILAQADVSDPAAVEAMAEHVHDELGPVDVLVNNAGITRDSRFDEMDREDWEAVIDVNLTGAFTTTKAFFEDLTAAEEGRLINISSVIGRQGNYGQTNYAAAKSGLFGFTRSIAKELAPHGTTANCVAPGYTRTEMVKSVREDIKDSIREDIPLDRFAEVEEIAATVAFIASTEASYITGEVIDANGGMSP